MESYEIYENLGISLENAIRNKILSNVPPPNDPKTIKAKGSSHTLIDTGTMLDSISHIVEYNSDTITIRSGILDEDEEIAKYAVANEYGVQYIKVNKLKDNIEEMHQGYSLIIIPERSFIRSTFDEIFDNELMENFTNNIEEFAKQKLGK